MRAIAWEELSGRQICDFGSEGFDLVPVAARAHVVLVVLAPGGRIGRHPAVVDQCLVVLSGEAEVRGADGVSLHLGPGSAVSWAAGESHETRSRLGLRAMIVEAEGLGPALG